MECWIGTKMLVLCSGYNATTLFTKYTKEVFRMQEARHSPNTPPTTAHCHSFRIII